MVNQVLPIKSEVRAYATLLAEAERAREQERLEPVRDFSDYIARIDPDYVFADHVRYLIDRLGAVERGEITRLMVFMPPQHGKTRTTSELFPAYYLGKHPHHRVISASYGEQYALYVGSKVREQLDSRDWPFPGVAPRSRSKADGSWGIAGFRGWFHTTSIGGGAVGRGANLFVIDDPIKNAEEADSPTYREKVYDWFKSVAYSRRNNELILEMGARQRKAAIILIGTRWHEDDLFGRLLREAKENPDADQWEVVEMPAIAEEDDPIGRRPGEALFPQMHPIEDLLQVRVNLPERWWNALYRQKPTGQKGNLFNRDWFKTTYSLAVLPPYKRIVHVCDSAWKKGVANSYSVIQTWGETDRYYDLLGVWRDRVSYDSLLTALADVYFLWLPYGGNELFIEDAASGQSAIQSLSEGVDPRGIVNVVPFSVASVSPYSFAETATPFFRAGRVRMPFSAPWLAAYVQEHVEFPTGKFTDQVICTAMALRVLSTGSASRGTVDLREFGKVVGRKSTILDRTIRDPLDPDIDWDEIDERHASFINTRVVQVGRQGR